MREKLMTLSRAADLVKDGMLLAIGGNAMHRNPSLFFLELTRRPVKNLKICGTALGIAADYLLATRQADTAYFGFLGFENEGGLAPGMRQSMEKDSATRAVEGSWTAIISALRAGAYGIPYMPVGGMWGSDLLELRPDFFRIAKSPFDGSEVVCVRALVPDFAILHVQEADIYGNARILGPVYQDILLSRAAKKTILTTERIVGTYRMREEPKLTAIPHIAVEAVVELPGGAKPGICYPEYMSADWEDHNRYTSAVKAGSVRDFADYMLGGRT